MAPLFHYFLFMQLQNSNRSGDGCPVTAHSKLTHTNCRELYLSYSFIRPAQQECGITDEQKRKFNFSNATFSLLYSFIFTIYYPFSTTHEKSVKNHSSISYTVNTKEVFRN